MRRGRSPTDGETQKGFGKQIFEMGNRELVTVGMKDELREGGGNGLVMFSEIGEVVRGRLRNLHRGSWKSGVGVGTYEEDLGRGEGDDG